MPGGTRATRRLGRIALDTMGFLPLLPSIYARNHLFSCLYDVRVVGEGCANRRYMARFQKILGTMR